MWSKTSSTQPKPLTWVVGRDPTQSKAFRNILPELDAMRSQEILTMGRTTRVSSKLQRRISVAVVAVMIY